MTTSATLSLGYVAVYVALVGVASFIEKPAGRGFGPFQLNALIRAGSLAAAAVALIFAHGLAFPAISYLLAGLGIGLITGAGSILYCFGLDYLPVSLVVTLSNLYIVITIVLGIVVLHEPVTVLKIAGLTCTMAGVLVLGHSPARYAAHPEASSASTPRQARGFAIMGIYIVVIGVGAFLEKPALKGLTATQLNALMGIAMTAVAGIALAAKGPRLPMTKRTLGGLGVGVMIGTASVFYFLGLRGLPVSVASATSNASVVVTVVLSAIFLHQRLGRARGAALALTLLGVTLLALSTG
jgi:drug/metabolite transporter (DMT)-like permease